MQFSANTDFEGVRTVHTVLHVDRHYIISSAIRKIEKGKQFVRTFGRFCSACGMNICSVNLDRETTFLTLCDVLSVDTESDHPYHYQPR